MRINETLKTPLDYIGGGGVTTIVRMECQEYKSTSSRGSMACKPLVGLVIRSGRPEDFSLYDIFKQSWVQQYGLVESRFPSGESCTVLPTTVKNLASLRTEVRRACKPFLGRRTG